MENKKIINNFVWRFLERCGAQGVAFIVQIALARILAPEVYGTIALVTVFITILQVFVDSGLGNALIQKKSADDIDFSTVFYFNVCVCCFLYLLMFSFAPAIASFYNDTELTSVIRVLSFTLVISGVKNVQQAYVSKTMQFKKFFFATSGGTLGSAVIGIVMAGAGFGIWALVAQQIFNAAVDTIILWVMVEWRPKCVFSFQRLKGLYNYGWKLLISSLINQLETEIRQLLIGKIYTSGDLAQYNRGQTFPNFVIANVNSSIDSVLLPSMSEEQDNVKRVKEMTRRAIKTSTYVIAPLMMGLVFTSKPLVKLILTEKWLPCIPFMVIFCITYMFYPIHTANLNAIKAIGRSDIYLKLEIIKKIFSFVILSATAWVSVMAMAISLLVTSLINQLVNSWPNRKLLNYGYLEQLKDIAPGILLAVFMGMCVYPVQLIGLPDMLTLCIQVPLGAMIYICLSALFQLESFNYILQVLKSYRKEGSEQAPL